MIPLVGPENVPDIKETGLNQTGLMNPRAESRGIDLLVNRQHLVLGTKVEKPGKEPELLPTNSTFDGQFLLHVLEQVSRKFDPGIVPVEFEDAVRRSGGWLGVEVRELGEQPNPGEQAEQ